MRLGHPREYEFETTEYLMTSLDEWIVQGRSRVLQESVSQFIGTAYVDCVREDIRHPVLNGELLILSGKEVDPGM